MAQPIGDQRGLAKAGPGRHQRQFETDTRIESLDKAAAGVQKGLRIVLEDRASLPRIRDMLAEKGRGEIRVVLQLDHGMRELEVRLPGRFDISPQRASALMGLSGVVAVQDL